MAKRFGRNQRRKMREQIAQLEERLHYMPLADEALHIVRRTVKEGIGINVAFVDDDATILVALAQRAILAGLDSDAQEPAKRKFSAAAEPHRADHERALGRPIARI